MAGFTKMVDMRRTSEEKSEDTMAAAAPSMGQPDYPYGLCISLDEADLEKLDLDHSCEVGDVIDLRALAKVTSVSAREVDGKHSCRIELQLQQIALESEEAEEAPAPRPRRARY